VEAALRVFRRNVHLAEDQLLLILGLQRVYDFAEVPFDVGESISHVRERLSHLSLVSGAAFGGFPSSSGSVLERDGTNHDISPSLGPGVFTAGDVASGGSDLPVPGLTWNVTADPDDVTVAELTELVAAHSEYRVNRNYYVCAACLVFIANNFRHSSPEHEADQVRKQHLAESAHIAKVIYDRIYGAGNA
jgi:hypothetical protein